MSITSPNLGLSIWSQGQDYFVYRDLRENFEKLDAHDHSSGKGVKINTGGIRDAAITYPKIASENVIESHLADQAVSTAKIADTAISTAKIANGSVTAAKLAPGVIETIPVVDTLPVGAAEGTVVDYRPLINDIYNLRPLWRMKRTGSVWTYISGTEYLTRGPGGFGVVTTTAPTMIASSDTFTLAYKGNYVFQWGCRVTSVFQNPGAQLECRIYSETTSTDIAYAYLAANTAKVDQQIVGAVTTLDIDPTTLLFRAAQSVTQACTYRDVWFWIRPRTLVAS